MYRKLLTTDRNNAYELTTDRNNAYEITQKTSSNLGSLGEVYCVICALHIFFAKISAKKINNA